MARLKSARGASIWQHLKEYHVPSFSSRIVRFFLKLMLAFFAGVFALSVLLVALGALALSSLKWLATGKKPAFAVIWSGMRTSRHRMGPAPGAGQVIDVEAREIAAIKGGPRPR